jgi:hypothetical protein
LDPGNNFAWSTIERDRPFSHGRWTYQSGDHKHSGDRWREFQNWFALFLVQKVRGHRVFVGYERPFFRGKPAEILHGYETIIMLECSRHDINPIAINPATLKKFATNNGRATKHDMREALQRELILKDVLHFKTQDMTEDEIDAMWVALHTQKKIMMLLETF